MFWIRFGGAVGQGVVRDVVWCSVGGVYVYMYTPEYLLWHFDIIGCRNRRHRPILNILWTCFIDFGCWKTLVPQSRDLMGLVSLGWAIQGQLHKTVKGLVFEHVKPLKPSNEKHINGVSAVATVFVLVHKQHWTDDSIVRFFNLTVFLLVDKPCFKWTVWTKVFIPCKHWPCAGGRSKVLHPRQPGVV